MSPSEIQLFVVAYLLRLFLVFCGDLFSPKGVKYQDIDYEVFTNASRHIYNGGIAYDCDTYRYTPLLAWILQPNIWLTPEFGKVLFITIDIIGAYLLHHIMKKYLKKIHPKYKIDSMLWLSILWLFNPMIFTISSRGSCDSIIILLVLSTFYLILNEEWYAAGIVYGAAVHFRIYPFIYSLSFILFISHLTILQQKGEKKRINALNLPLSSVFSKMFFNVNVWSFGLMSLFSFMCFNTICYLFMGGDIYVKESYLYHFSRIDYQHNFSAYFYFFSLSKLDSYDNLEFIDNCYYNVHHDMIGHCVAPLISRFSFIPQLGYIIIISCITYRNLHLSLFMTTFIFVTFNKVCTSQYFTWYICLFPMVLPFLASKIDISWKTIFCGFRMKKAKSWWYGMFCCILAWFAGNGHWLYWAYRYEIMREPDKLFMVWVASIIFFIINNVLLILIGEHYDSYPLLLNYVKLSKKKKKKKKA